MAKVGCGGSDPGVSAKPEGDAGGIVDAGSGDGNEAAFDVQPAGLQTLTVDASAAMRPTVTFKATLEGEPVQAVWSVDRSEVGTIEAGRRSSAVFTPSGNAGGLVIVRAEFNGDVVEREVWVELSASQNGPDLGSSDEMRQVATDVDSLKAGGGIGGVGGEGLGPAVNDASVRTLLDMPTSDGSAEKLRFLYPYDGTVWPRGLLAPLLMWQSTLGGVDAVKIELRTTSGSFRWSGTFAAPTILATTGGDFIRHPIPQGAWKSATDTAGGATPKGTPDGLEVRLTVAKGDRAYGPIVQTWSVAPARVSGTIYYSSYGTNLAKNFSGAQGGDGKFGGAVLSIRVGDTGPSLVAGSDGDRSYCRVCHSASADGSRLTAVGGDSSDTSYAYATSPTGVTEQVIAATAGAVVKYPGLTADGRFALTERGELLDLENGAAKVAVTGLSEVATALGTPSFSYAGNKVVFNLIASSSIMNPRRKVMVMDFDRGALAFANALTVVDNSTDANPEVRPGWPSFTPDGAVVYHQQIKAGFDGNNGGALLTRKGSKAYLAWTPATGANPTPLHRLNGLDERGESYLPSLSAPTPLACTADSRSVGELDADHADDPNLNYEPTVSPIATGGYAWVVFTSRRMYGNVADIPPFCSDPRGVDLFEHITTKKLWVAALDLNGKPGQDISHPAFYLPAQELLAGNTRGSWVLDPCRADGDTCETGDQCCNGYCSANGEGELVCGNTSPQCSQLQERCESDADCCDAASACINGFCSQVILQ